MFHNQNFKKMMQKLKTVILLVAVLFFATSCHDYFEGASPQVDLEQSKKGPGGGGGGGDDDSDRPPWAGGNTDENPHKKGNDNSGTTRGGDYGDLYVLDRNLDGVPNMAELPVLDEEGIPTGETFWVVRPVDEDGNLLELDAEGGLTEESLLLAQSVEFGRLNIVRSPQSVMDQAMREALKVINAGEAFSLDFCGRLTTWNTVDGVLTITKTIDSPRESMAMYQEIMNNGFSDELDALVGSEIDPSMLAASCFAGGSDKTGTVDIDEVVYINGFMDCLGCNPIENEHEYDFNNDLKYYWNFGDCDCEGNAFTYNRETTYADRHLQFYDYIDGEYIPAGEPVSVLEAMESRGLFMYRYNGIATHVDGFAAAVDDAVQVLDFVHGNSNIEFVAVAPE